MNVSWFRLQTVVAGVLVLVGSAGGCGKSEVRYSDDDDDGTGGQGLTTTTTASSSSGQVPAPGEADGSFLMTLSLVLFPPTPIVFEATLYTSAGAQGLDLTMDLQPLATADRETPVGAPFSLGGPYPVASDGSFTLVPATVDIPGQANPISGNDIAADVTLSGILWSPANVICGQADGVTVSPPGISLDGSTFTLERIGAPGPPYPEPPQINCAGDLAQPL